MARLSRSREDAPNALVGAARRVHINRRDEVDQLRERGVDEWQRLAWRCYDEIGEVKYAFNYFAAVSSRIRFFVGYQDEASDTPVPIGSVEGLDRSFTTAARYELSKLGNGIGGQPNLIRSAILNLLVAGELYLIGQNNVWAAHSTSELRFEADKRIRLVKTRNVTRSNGTPLPESAYVARIWRTHAEYSDDADSSLKGVRNECSELLLLSRIIRASAQSRLNAGILYVADELRFQRSQDPSAEPTPDVDPFEEELNLALTEPVGATDSPSEIVPMIVRGPAEFAETGIVKIDLSRGFDKEVVARHDQTLSRVLNGLDIPRDLVTGLANVRYSNGKVITEDLLKAHVEPLVLLLCEGLTTAYLRVQMTARGYDPHLINNLHVWYDPSEVVTRPDRSEDADKGYERMLIKGETWRRSHGFSEQDAPDEDELAMRIALSGGVAQSTTLDFLRKLAPDLVKEAERLARDSFGDPNTATPDSAFTPSTPSSPPPIGAQPIAPTPAEANPPEGTPAPNDGLSSKVIDIVHALTAGAQRQSDVVRDRTRRMERSLEVERRLRESMFVHLNDVVHRSLERAGARTVSKTRGDGELKTLTSVVPLEAAFSVIPDDRLQEFALDGPRMVRDTLEKARASFFELVTAAQDQGWRALGTHVYERMKPRQGEFLEGAWTWLLEKLTTLATKWLRNPRKSGSYVDMDTVRHAAALAGGAKKFTPKSTGRAILSDVSLDETEWEFSDRYRWVYGVSENSFEPHVRLDDRVFSSWTGRELRALGSDEWPYVTHYYPGDHNGCRCDWLPEVLDPRQVNMPERGQTWPDFELPVAASGAPISLNGHPVLESSLSGHTRP